MLLVRSITADDKKDLIRVVKLQKNFLQCEIDIAIEVIVATFDPAEDYQTLAAFDEHQCLLGFISFGPIPLTVNRFDIYWVAVDPDKGRHGTGTVLILEMEKRLKQAGSGHIYVETSSTEGYGPARMFYEKHNYQLMSQLKDFYRDGDDKMIYRKIY